MEIFYIKKDDFKAGINLEPFIDIETKSEKRKLEYGASRLVLNLALKNFYNKKTFEIITENNKPRLNDNSIYFSISHSKEVAAVCFSHSPVGFDIEFIKTRNLEKLSKYFKKDFADLKAFYKFWTEYEAKYKLQAQPAEIKTFEFLNDYMAAIASPKAFLGVKIFKINSGLNFEQIL